MQQNRMSILYTSKYINASFRTIKRYLKLMQELNLITRHSRLDKSRRGELVYFSNSRLKDCRNEYQLQTRKYLHWNNKLYKCLQTSTTFLHHDKASSRPKHVLFLLLPVFHLFCSPVSPKIRQKHP